MINTRAPDGANNDTIIQHKSPQMIQCQLLFSYLMKIQRYKISLYRHNVDKKRSLLIRQRQNYIFAHILHILLFPKVCFFLQMEKLPSLRESPGEQPLRREGRARPFRGVLSVRVSASRDWRMKCSQTCPWSPPLLTLDRIRIKISLPWIELEIVDLG